jgi:multiple sugar transport system permease protein
MTGRVKYVATTGAVPGKAAAQTRRIRGKRPGPRQGGGRTWSRMRREWSAYVFLAPGLIIFSVFTVAALMFAFYLTFHEWNVIQPYKPFVGLDNYKEMIHDKDYIASIVNTVYYTGGSVPLGMLVGLSLAVLLNLPIRFRGTFRTLYYLPVITPLVAASILWKWLYNSDYGLFDYYLLKAHLIDQPLLWLSSQNLAMPAVILMTVWMSAGFSMVVYLAGLQSIPEELYEAAKIDGAGPVARLRKITLPMLRPTTLFLLVIGIIGSFQVFTQIFIMTNGGPVNKTTTMVFFIYQAAFKFYEFGYASTLAFGLFALLFVVTLIQLRLYRRADL